MIWIIYKSRSLLLSFGIHILNIQNRRIWKLLVCPVLVWPFSVFLWTGIMKLKTLITLKILLEEFVLAVKVLWNCRSSYGKVQTRRMIAFRKFYSHTFFVNVFKNIWQGFSWNILKTFDTAFQKHILICLELLWIPGSN